VIIIKTFVTFSLDEKVTKNYSLVYFIFIGVHECPAFQGKTKHQRASPGRPSRFAEPTALKAQKLVKKN